MTIRTLTLFTAFCVLAVWLPPGTASAQTSDPQIKPYRDFLATQTTSAKEYILKLFDTHDIVMICERDHRDTTQYDLYLSLIADKRFIDMVGIVFTEIGVSTLNPALNRFLHARSLAQDSVERAILGFQRDCSWSPLWEKENFSILLRGIYGINQKLSDDRKIGLTTCDMPFDWWHADTASYRAFWKTMADIRDSVMASQIMHVFDSLSTSGSVRKKALVIVNYRHAFGHRFESPVGKKPNNTGRFLFEHYGTRVANVYVNWLALALKPPAEDIALTLIHDGVWDAAFHAMKIEDRGFDFAGSPFGRDAFDIWPRKNPFTYSDVFDGMVFWQPLEKHRAVVGVPGFIDPAFANEYLRRNIIYNTILGQSTDITIDSLRGDANERKVIPTEGLDSLLVKRDKWLK